MEYYGDKVDRAAYSLTERSKLDSTHVEQKPTRVALRADGGDVGAAAFWDEWATEELPFLAEQRP